MADHAVGGEAALTRVDILVGGWERIRVGTTADGQAALRTLHEGGLKVARRTNFASRELQQGRRRNRGGNSSLHAVERTASFWHGNSTTIVIIMLPWLVPQK
jgi:hypothetical protein